MSDRNEPKRLRIELIAGACGAALVMTPQTSHAWGYEGHRIVAAIARSYLAPAVKAKVDALLAADTDMLEPHDILSAATWADSFRRDHRETAPWHFVDIELAKPDLDTACFGHPPSAFPASAGPERACLIDRLEAFEAELADPATPQAERIVALKFVLHFVGDIHQPLHASDDDDHGGNCVRIALGGARTTNLHSHWDTGLITALGTDPEAIAAQLRSQITKGQQKAWMAGDARAWALESFEVAKAAAYWPGAPRGCAGDTAPVNLPLGYDAAAKAVVAQQLEKAGVRLAWLLGSLLATG